MKINKLESVKSLKNKRVLLRVDFNVPIKNGVVADDFKIRASLPTIQYLLKKNARIIIVSHLGRPKGADNDLTLKPVAKVLEKLTDQKVQFCKMEDAPSADGSIMLLENIRFYPGEEKNDSVFARSLSELADIFVLDGFAVAHRDSASVSGVAKFLPAYAGLLLTREIVGLDRAVDHPKKPMVAIIGGAKTETKIPVVKNLLKKADYILIGGGIANTFWWAKGASVGDSIVDKQFKKEIIKICSNKKIILPLDVVVGSKNGKKSRVIKCRLPHHNSLTCLDLRLSAKEGVYDIGPGTVKLFSEYIKKAHTLVINGALGYFEQPPYQHGTYAISRLFAARSRGRAYGVAGGGETVQILQKLGIMDDVDLVSTGGGAMLEYMSGDDLPGVRAVSARRK